MNNPMARAALIFAGVFILLVLVGQLIGPGRSGGKVSLLGGKVARIDIEGVITASAPSGSLFAPGGEASSVAICESLYEIADDPLYKAVVLRVNSPGGSAAGSDEIYRAILAVRAADKPVVVSMGDIAASGGYYVAAPADYIIANGATLTGSIGVIFQLINIEALGEKIGVSDVTLHAGEYKDLGNPWREMTAQEREILTSLLTQVHEQFIVAVDEGREGLDAAQVRALATGTIWTGEGAVANGLVDAVGGLADAEAKARELAGLSENALVETYPSGDFWDMLFAARAPTGLAEAAAEQLGGGLLEQLAGSLMLNTTLRDLRIR